MPEAWNEKAVFLTAAGLKGEDREAFLRGACPTPAARERIDALLAQIDAQPAPSLRPLPASLADGVTIDEFRMLRRVGTGGMGTVYLAEDTLLHRQVAVKILAGHLLGSEQALGRFKDEARNAAALRHPSIVPVFKLGFDGQHHYIVSEFIDGPTLGELIIQQRAARAASSSTQSLRSWHRRVAEIASSIADALECSHRAGIIHRDVKPSNILLDAAGNARLTDFGIAKHIVPGVTATQSDVIGSCHYMSPEQAKVSGAKIDQRSDVFSLGVVLYEMLALRRPFDGSDANQVLRAVIGDDPPRLRSLDAAIPRDLETICRKAMEKDPFLRYQSAAHLAADLRSWLEGRPILARPPSALRIARRFITTHKLPVAIAACIALATGVVIAAFLLRSAHEATLAWVSVEAAKPNLNVYLQMHDSNTLDLPMQAELAGVVPLRDLKIPPGQYRITVATPDGSAFAEFNAILLAPGAANRVLLRVGDETDRPDPPPNAGSNSAPRIPPQVRFARLLPTAQVHAANMIPIPGGEYIFGWIKSGDASSTLRTVRLPAFHIDRTRVSNREYREFTTSTGYPEPRNWTNYGYDESAADLPVVGVTIHDAEAYARWRGKRLPTMFEWQAATRGPQGWRFPNGPNLPADAAHLDPKCDSLIAEQSSDPKEHFALYLANAIAVTAPDPFMTPLGLMHSFDSVRELTANVALPRPDVVMQGRSWSESLQFADLARNRTTPLTGFSVKMGFRCAKSDSIPPVPGSSSPSTNSGS